MVSLASMIEHILDHPGGASGAIYDEEIRRGWSAMHPGDAPWFPSEDWKIGSVASVNSGIARLILLDALRPNTGAFTRLVAAIRATGLRPIVVEPTREFQSILCRKGWKRRSVGYGFSHHEEVWRHPADRRPIPKEGET